MHAASIAGITREQAVCDLIKALGNGVLKTMSKMGISSASWKRGYAAWT